MDWRCDALTLATMEKYDHTHGAKIIQATPSHSHYILCARLFRPKYIAIYPESFTTPVSYCGVIYGAYRQIWFLGLQKGLNTTFWAKPLVVVF